MGRFGERSRDRVGTALLLVLALACAARADETGARVEYTEPPPDWTWHPPSALEVTLQTAAVGLIWVDVLQSMDPKATGRETAPFLPSYPSHAQLALLGGALPTVATTALWLYLPRHARNLVPLVIAAIEVPVVLRNHQVGFRVSF